MIEDKITMVLGLDVYNGGTYIQIYYSEESTNGKLTSKDKTFFFIQLKTKNILLYIQSYTIPTKDKLNT